VTPLYFTYKPDFRQIMIILKSCWSQNHIQQLLIQIRLVKNIKTHEDTRYTKRVLKHTYIVLVF